MRMCLLSRMLPPLKSNDSVRPNLYIESNHSLPSRMDFCKDKNDIYGIVLDSI